MVEPKPSLWKRLRRVVIGRARSHEDTSIFHQLTLIAFFAWVGLGADGLSSSAYGPEEAFLALQEHNAQYLAIFVALASVFTIFVISTSYSQIIELFPNGGGGYLVATKLLSPVAGVVSGSALLIDYVLTIAISIAAGTDALFSVLPAGWAPMRMEVALAGIAVLSLLNLRGVKESVIPLVPVFLIFVVTHAAAILWALATHLTQFPEVAQGTVESVRNAVNEVRPDGSTAGVLGLFVLILRAYSMGAGTFTGIEAVSNGMQILREPRVQTAKRTMRYMAWSLALTVLGLMLAYLLFSVRKDGQETRTLNAILFEAIAGDWGRAGTIFVWVALLSETALLFIAAQAGFMDGPRVLSNMALDSWMPRRFATLSDRFVTQNGILMMGAAAAAVVLLTRGSVRYLVVLYSINVFITFTLSQAGMVRHWWGVRATDPKWRHKFAINGIGLVLCSFILVSVVVLKFHEGGWITLLLTGGLVAIVFAIKRHYTYTAGILRRLDGLVRVAEPSPGHALPPAAPPAALDANAKTAVLLVNGFSGVGLHTLFSVVRLFGGIFRNFVFVQIGAIDAGVFKGVDEIESLKEQVSADVNRYVKFMNQNGYFAEGISTVGVDIVDEAAKIANQIRERYPQSVFFGGQLVFPQDSFIIRWLHNYTVFALQRKFYLHGIPFVILPIRV